MVIIPSNFLGRPLSSGSIKKNSDYRGNIRFQSASSTSGSEKDSIPFSQVHLTNPRRLQFFTSALVVLPVFLQAPWVHFFPFSALFFTFVLLFSGVALVFFAGKQWEQIGSLLVGVSGSWLGGCLFWGWLRAHPALHLPVEAIALPLACVGLGTRWRLGASFYLSCLIGAAFTDLMMVLTGVMKFWPDVVKASAIDASRLLQQTSQNLLSFQSLFLLLIAAGLIILISNLMRQRATLYNPMGTSWLVASAALTTTLWVDALFVLTTLIQPRLSGLI